MKMDIVEKNRKQDTMNLITWAKKRKEQLKEQVRYYVSEGMTPEKSLNVALECTILSSNLKEEIRKEILVEMGGHDNEKR